MSRAAQEAVAQGHSIHSSCQVFGLPRASCYRYASLLKAAEIDDLLHPQVQQATLEWSCYGYRPVTHELKRQGVRVNHSMPSWQRQHCEWPFKEREPQVHHSDYR